MISPNSLNKEISNDSGKFSGPSSVIISETDEEVFGMFLIIVSIIKFFIFFYF